MNSEISTAVDSDLDPYSLETLQNPHPMHESLRRAGPIVRFTKYGLWGMARYKDVHAVLNDHQTYINAGGVGPSDIRKDPNPVLARRLTLEIDPPDHAKYRAILTRALSPLTVKKLREDFTLAAEALVDELIERKSLDGVKDVAEAFPLKVFPDAIGVQPEGRENLLKWSRVVFNSFGPANDILKASLPAGQAAYAWVVESCKRENITPGTLGAMIYEASDRGELALEDAPLLVRPFLTAGIDTTISAIGAMLHGLALNPDQWELLRNNPALARSAFEEAVRWDSPIQSFCRTTGRDVEFAGQKLPEGTKIVLFLGAANRDPARWDEAERYRIERDTQGHVGFGSGIHACVGQMVARLEGEVLLAAMLKRIKTISLREAPTQDINNTMRALKSLPLEISPI